MRPINHNQHITTKNFATLTEKIISIVFKMFFDILFVLIKNRTFNLILNDRKSSIKFAQIAVWVRIKPRQQMIFTFQLNNII